MKKINKKDKPSYKTLLNKKDPLDERILQLAKNGELKIGVVSVKGKIINADV